MGKWGTGKILKICFRCKKEFYARKDRLGKFCSRSCGSAFKPKVYLRIWKKCEVCSSDFEIKRYRKDSALYCSVGCRRKRMPAKESHPRWKGGLDRTWESKALIKKLIKEKGKCEECNSKNELQGHHIVEYSKNKVLGNEITNIKILCIQCHAKKHPQISNFILKGKKYE